MTFGVVMLVHDALHRAAQVARHWSEGGCPVVIHVDRKVDAAALAAFRDALADLEDVRFCRRHRCDWGTWSLVAATQGAAERMLTDFPRVGHVYLASGSCLPLRPVAELRDYLAARADTDFIESVTTEDVPWTVGGLSLERFVFRFPFSWRTQRRLFDGYVRLQRKVGFRRTIPAGLVPHLGSQWWCLTRATLGRILYSSEREVWDRYFRRVWIPDESYFQTLVRRVSDKVESRSLTLSKFDFQGKPHIFYDDHLQLLRRSGCFVARKVWPRANRLYDVFLKQEQPPRPGMEPNPGRIERIFARALDQRVKGRAGLYMQSRFPGGGWEMGRTAAAYSVFQGFDVLFPEFPAWLERMTGAKVHGALFAPEGAVFAGGQTSFAGTLSSDARLRDYNPVAFLTNFLWASRGQRQCFQFGPRDNQGPAWFMATDSNAQISVISGAWAVPLMRSRKGFAKVRKEAARLQKIEAAHLQILQSRHVRARVRIWSMAEFVENPMEPLQDILAEIGLAGGRPLTEVPRMVDLRGFGAFLQRLRNAGMHPHLMGDFSMTDDGAAPVPSQKPYLVR